MPKIINKATHDITISDGLTVGRGGWINADASLIQSAKTHPVTAAMIAAGTLEIEESGEDEAEVAAKVEVEVAAKTSKSKA